MLRLFLALVLIPLWVTPLAWSATKGPSQNVPGDFVVENGFIVEKELDGFDYPSAIAFVPNPGSDPKSPLYFVTELRGKIKVVTQDRSVFTFAENFFRLVPPKELPYPYGEMGMAGIMLDPVHGYVFVSFLYQDEKKVLHNNIVRFESEPRVFGLKAGKSLSFEDIFAGDVATTHQIGPMVLDGDKMFVAVGDGFQPFHSQSLESTAGKILRMTLDGLPLPDNPFYEDQGRKNPANYVWALGLRNTFGLALAEGRLFASDNGLNIDRFLEIRRGQNYGWDGTDWSTGANAPMVFGPSVGPVQVAWIRPGNTLFPRPYDSKFLVALSGGQAGAAGLALVDYDFEHSRLTSRPSQFLHYVGRDRFNPVGVAWGPDALYVVLLNRAALVNGSKGTIVKVRYVGQAAALSRASGTESAPSIMLRLACVHCHGESPGEYRMGPPLDDQTLIPRILAQLSTPEYRQSVAELDALTEEPYSKYREARKKVLAASGNDRARLWIKYRVMEPRFDRRVSSMPTLGLNEDEAQRVADYLVSRHQGEAGWKGAVNRLVERFFPRVANRRHVAAAFVLGFGVAAVLLWVAQRLRVRLQPRSSTA